MLSPKRAANLSQGKFEDQIRALEDSLVANGEARTDAVYVDVDEYAVIQWLSVVGDFESIATEDQIMGIQARTQKVVDDAIDASERIVNNESRGAYLKGGELGRVQFKEMAEMERSPALDEDQLLASRTPYTARFGSEINGAIAAALLGATTVFALRAAYQQGKRVTDVHLRSGITWNTNAGSNWVKGQQIVQGGYAKMWVAERDACLHCLALSGAVTYESFDAGATFATKPLKAFNSLPEPPRHPFCRCSIVPTTPGDDKGASKALNREAERSVAKGFADASEPQARAAAEQLLYNDPDLADSVVANTAARLRSESQFRQDVP